MKTIALILLATSLAGFAQEMGSQLDQNGNLQLTPAEYQQLSNRFVTTIKETQVDSQLLEVPDIKDITTKLKITEADLKLAPNDPNSPQEKRKKAKDEFKKKFDTLSEGQIQELEKKLKLDSYGLVQGKDRETLMKFFSDRIEKALYGVGASGEALRLKDSKLVDHKVYNDLYTSQLGKSILLELSNYCYNTVSPFDSTRALDPGSPEAFTKWDTLISGNPSICSVPIGDHKAMANCVYNVTDTGTPRTASYQNGNKPDPYKELSQRLSSLPNAQQFLSSYFTTCSRLVPYLCELQSYCKLDAANKTAWGQSSEFIKEYIAKNGGDFCASLSNRGENSCVVQNRLKAYRTNLQLATQSDQKLKTDYLDNNRLGNFNSGKTIYDESSRDDNSLESITSLSSQDTADVLKKATETNVDEFKKKQCESRPEEKDCEAFFYNDQETARFEDSSLRYVAATELEKKKLDDLKGKQDKLKEYLAAKGYADLVDQVGKVDGEKIVALAKARFEAERESSFNKMEEAFKKKQISKDATTADNTGKADKVKNELQDKGNKFTQLLIFNNVITSYLQIEKDGKKYSNSRVLERENQKISQAGGAVDSSAAQFFSNLGGKTNGGGSSGSATTDELGGGASLVDVGFLDQILADKPAAKPGAR